MNELPNVSRRSFLQSAVVAGALPASAEAGAESAPQDPPATGGAVSLDAHWIWYPEARTLPATFVFFRRSVELPAVPAVANAWVTANSRYMLYVNGGFIQRGPAPSDPRMVDVDPADLRPLLKPGQNVIGVLVCHFGHGDGTYVPTEVPAGAAGLLFQLDIQAGGAASRIVSDESWKCHRARCWPAGKYQRWFLRAIQEDFDARQYPYGWTAEGFDDDAWVAPRVKQSYPGLPNIEDLPREGWHADWKLTPRSIPYMLEQPFAPAKLGPAGRIHWKIAPEEYFDCFSSDAFTETVDPSVITPNPGGALFPLTAHVEEHGTTAVTFEFDEEISGHIFLRLRAPAGTVCDILYVEAQQPDKLMLRVSSSHAEWMRVTTRDGETVFESFDYDALRWLQLLIRNTSGPVEILDARVNRRLYPYPQKPDLRTSSDTLNRVFQGSVNSHLITCQETIMDNVTRERQQYAGDVDHAKQASYFAFGEYRQPRRMLHTFSQGQSADGWFLDCYPGWDRCTRLWQKHLSLTQWGPLIDHGMGFLMSVATYHLFSGDLDTVRALYPRLQRFDKWLRAQVGPDGLLPVSGYTWNDVWIDHFGWKTQADKVAALNIYYVGYLREGVARLADLMHQPAVAAEARRRADQTAALTRRLFWSPRHRLVVDNLPRLAQDGELRLHDRTSAMALLYGIIPAGQEQTTLDLLAGLPTHESPPMFPLPGEKGVIGFSFTANTCWRYWALTRFGRGEAVVRDLEERWGSMISLAQNKTFSEWWHPRPSVKGEVWAQNTQVPIFLLYGHILGITPTQPAFAKFDVRPQRGSLRFIEGTAHSPSGGIRLRCDGGAESLELSLDVPAGLEPALVLPAGWQPRNIPAVSPESFAVRGFSRWRLPRMETPHRWEIRAVKA